MKESERSHKLLLLGLLGSFLCWISVLLLGGSDGLLPDPRWGDLPAWRFVLSGALGSLAMILVLIGFFGLYRLVRPAHRTANGILFGGLLACVPGAVFHFLFSSGAWLYVRLGGTDWAAQVIADLFATHTSIIGISFLGMIVASLSLASCIARGKTPFPRWALPCNILTIQLLGSLLSPWILLPGISSLGGMLMFAGLYRTCGVPQAPTLSL